MPVVHAYFEADAEDLDALALRMRLRLGSAGKITDLPSTSKRWRTFAVEFPAAGDQRDAMERLQRLIREAGGYEMLRGGDTIVTRYAPPPRWAA